MLLPLAIPDVTASQAEVAAERANTYPRLRFMGSKYRLALPLAEVFSSLPAGPAVDGFSGSGIVSYLLKALGRQVLSNDQLSFASTMADALVVNDRVTLSRADVDRLCGASRDNRSFIADTFDGLYFDRADHQFLDSCWSHIDELTGPKRSLALSALFLAAARKQPRGVFTVTARQYDDQRRHLRMTMRELFVEATGEVNCAVFESDGATPSRALVGDVFDVPPDDVSLAYLDPPYAPIRDDTDYIKRYHFLEGLATYWRGQEIMWETKTRKLAKRHTPFAYKRSAPEALDRAFAHFRGAALVVSYGSNAAVSADELTTLLFRHRTSVERLDIPHRYAFGTHGQAVRREATEYVFIATGSR